MNISSAMGTWCETIISWIARSFFMESRIYLEEISNGTYLGESLFSPFFCTRSPPTERRDVVTPQSFHKKPLVSIVPTPILLEGRKNPSRRILFFSFRTKKMYHVLLCRYAKSMTMRQLQVATELKLIDN
jgi:hypothetical protein